MNYLKAQSLYDAWKHGKCSTRSTENKVRKLLTKDNTLAQESDLLMVLSEIGVSY